MNDDDYATDGRGMKHITLGEGKAKTRMLVQVDLWG